MVLVDQSLPEGMAKAASSLEDRRLWGGPVTEAAKLTWGPPGKSWTATKAKDFWEIKGPDGAEVKQPAARLELALWKLQNLEYSAIVKRPRGGPSPEAFVLEVFTGGGLPVFRLQELGQDGNQVLLSARKGDQTLTALVPAKNLAEIRDDLTRLTAPAPAKPKD